MRMDEISTSKLRKHNPEKELMFNAINIETDSSFEKNLIILLDKQLVNPREQIVNQILDFSKRSL